VGLYPDLGIKTMKKSEYPKPLVIGAGRMHALDIDLMSAETEETAELMSNVVNDMTKSHFKSITCEQIDDNLNSKKPCFIYFGDVADIEGGEMDELNMVASFDNFNNPFEPMDFHINSDKECKKKHGFAAD